MSAYLPYLFPSVSTYLAGTVLCAYISRTNWDKKPNLASAAYITALALNTLAFAAKSRSPWLGIALAVFTAIELQPKITSTTADSLVLSMHTASFIFSIVFN